MRRLATVAVVVVTTALAGQQRPEHQKHPVPPPVHAPHPELPPSVALAHVRAGNLRAVSARTQDRPLPIPAERAAGAGRFVVAVLTCADAALDVPALLGLRSEDVLVISNAGAVGDAGAVELLEWAAREERLSLCIVLAHQPCRSCDDRKAAVTRAAAARDLAQRRRIEVPKAHALLQRERLLSASTVLSDLAAASRFAIVPATVDTASGAIDWHTTRAEELPIAPVK